MESTPDTFSDAGDADAVRPLRDGDATAPADPAADPAQTEWDRTEALDSAAAENDPDPSIGDDPVGTPGGDPEIPAEDLPDSELQPESQGEDPLVAELGEEGEGDLAPEDL
ncbi:sugar ABC transporter ATPase [Leucobacter sp. CSA1]|uniref:Sugar ABC transporter ATPase n=1 Tax=Leucobacter chromiisoli TaxID=2796471 RepID=A0A934Q8B3_9MICO|nr:sugar ABC transporter ATPase [Leucobacter chromiisoli]MBK0420105.1 sugar ABC transporter ATPase [Leucobacter chromiisoli]